MDEPHRQPLYQCEPPTGYSNKADAWGEHGCIAQPHEFSLALTGNRLRGTQVNMETLLGDRAATDPHATSTGPLRRCLAGSCRSKLVKRSKAIGRSANFGKRAWMIL